ncbi:MAG: hypothetical protein H0U76_13775 [Ktedonobacteraceae bacterium]|nr:hypothetical protein [Ktedonobacteraceae bacterium]
MRRHIPGLHSREQALEGSLDGLFLVRIDRAAYRLHPQKPFLALQFAVLEPITLESQSFHGRLYCTRRALWKLEWFLRDFGYDAELLDRDQVDEKALLGLRGVVRTSHTAVNGRSYQNLDSFAPFEDWPTLRSGTVGAETEVADGL